MSSKLGSSVEEQGAQNNEKLAAVVTPTNGGKDFEAATEEGNNPNEDESATKKETALPPVPFLSLFRFQTPFETTLNLLGLVAAAAAGAAQPLMSLLFGNLTQAFIEFGAALSQGQDVTSAAQNFKEGAARDALFIFVIGEQFISFTRQKLY